MAMIKCKECGNEISTKAKKCTSCGVDTRNWFLRHKFLTFIGGFVLIGIIGAIAGGDDKIQTVSSDLNKNKSAQHSEELISNEGVSSNVKITITSVDTKEMIGDNQFTMKEAQGIFKVIKLKLENNQNDAITIDTNSFKLTDNKGREFSYSSDAQMALMSSVNNKEESFFLTKLNPGLSIEGSIVFDIPKGSEGIVLKARGGITGKEIKLKVE